MTLKPGSKYDTSLGVALRLYAMRHVKRTHFYWCVALCCIKTLPCALRSGFDARNATPREASYYCEPVLSKQICLCIYDHGTVCVCVCVCGRREECIYVVIYLLCTGCSYMYM